MTTPGAPVTRQTLMDTLQAYKRTGLMRAALELRIYDALAAGARTAADVANAVRADARGVRVLLGALAAEQLLGEDDTGYLLPEGAAQFLVSTSPEYSGGAARVAASDWEWDAVRDLAAAVRAGDTLMSSSLEAPGFPYWLDFAAQNTFVTRLASTAVADLLLPWAKEREPLRVLDAGCGHAVFGSAVLQQHPQATLTAMDWENVLSVARGRVAKAGVADRVTYRAGDLFADPLGGPYDLVLLANMLPMFSPERGAVLLRRAGDVLAPGGRIVTVGFSAGQRDAVREHPAHMLSVIMLAGTHGGEAHSLETCREMFTASGIAVVEEFALDKVPVQILIGERAEGAPQPNRRDR
ncbi:MAG: class I SAM-dependent methyltransferase [Actinocatenispora sp.]